MTTPIEAITQPLIVRKRRMLRMMTGMTKFTSTIVQNSGEKVPFWDSRDEFGDTCLLVLKPEEGRSLAKALGSGWLVLMRRHGASVAGRNLTELVFRTIYQYRNAELQLMTHSLGMPLSPLTPGEAKLAEARNSRGTLIASGFIAGGAIMGVIAALLKFLKAWHHEALDGHGALVLLHPMAVEHARLDDGAGHARGQL